MYIPPREVHAIKHDSRLDTFVVVLDDCVEVSFPYRRSVPDYLLGYCEHHVPNHIDDDFNETWVLREG